MTKSPDAPRQEPANTYPGSDPHRLLQTTIGLGTAPLGNMFREIPDEEAAATLQAAWDEGIRYFDTAPFYGSGLAESRLGEMLAAHDRTAYTLSSKVGRYILDEQEKKSGLFANARKNKVVTDYTADATLRSVEQSLERLRTDRLDFVFIHDISRDFHGDEWISRFDEARTGAFRALTRLREEGVINAWGIGVNTTEPIELALEMEETRPNLCLTATQYTVLQHQRALERMMPSAAAKGVGIVVGAPYNSGALLGGDHFDYGDIPTEVTHRVQQIGQTAESHGVSLKAAALQFSTAHPATVAVLPGSSRPQRIAEDTAALQETIPTVFWNELLQRELISAEAPLPNME